MLFLNVKILPRNKLLEKSGYSLFPPIPFLLNNFFSISPEVAFSLYSKSLLPKMPYNISPAKNLRQMIYSVSCFLRIPDFSIFKSGHCLPSIHKFIYLSLIWKSFTLFHVAVLTFVLAGFCLACLFKCSCHLLMMCQQVLWGKKDSKSKK